MSQAFPWHRFVAEAESFPLASKESFCCNGIALRRTDDFSPYGETRQLANDLLDHLRPRATGLSLDALSSLRDRIWSSRCSVATPLVPLHDFVAGIAREYLGWEGTHVGLRCPVGETDLPERAAAWRWLTLRVPDDLLVAASIPPSENEYPHGHVRLLPPQLERMLQEDGASETHLHLGGAVSTSVLWSAMAASLHQRDRDEDFQALSSLGEIPFGGVENFLAVLRAAMCTRLLLTAYLDECRPQGENDFQTWFLRYTQALTRRMPAGSACDSLGEALRAMIEELCAGKVNDPTSARTVYDGLLGETRPARAYDAIAARGYALAELLDGPPDARRRPQVILEDPLTHGADPETRASLRIEGDLALRGLRWLAKHSLTSADLRAGTPCFARCFWQYQRVRGIFHRFITPEPGTSGLDWFSKHFRRVSTFTNPISAVLPALALRHASTSLRLASFEGRIAPPSPSGSLREDLRWFLDGALSIPHARRPEVGLILHFIKAERPADSVKLPRYGDPSGDVRYRRWYRAKRPELVAIRTLLAHTPEALVLLRGLDVASRELSLPTWVIAAILKAAREASRHAAAELSRRHPTWDVPPMRVTVHAGEDYRRLPDGLRRMGELLQHGCVGLGDRIGHGLALGTDPARWAERFTRMVQPREERLDDLLWEIALYDDGSLPADGARVASVRAEARRHLRDIYGNEDGDRPLPSIEDLIELRTLLHRGPGAEVLDAHRNDFEIPAGVPSRLQDVFRRYLTDREVYLRSVVPIEVETSEGEVRAMVAMQTYLRALLGRLEVTVESNPSSNLLIGDLEDLRDHPAMRLAPLDDPAGLQGSAVLLSLNSDDPVTFATSLGDEYAHMYFALLRAKVSSARALRWLNAIRRNGWRSRFTLPISRDPGVLNEVYRALLPLAVPRSPT